ncbi:MAG: hypothetical protein ACI84K_002121 [Pseudohongiellaceae bacterium]|jgi:hypothetical protein
MSTGPDNYIFIGTDVLLMKIYKVRFVEKNIMKSFDLYTFNDLGFLDKVLGTYPIYRAGALFVATRMIPYIQ